MLGKIQKLLLALAFVAFLALITLAHLFRLDRPSALTTQLVDSFHGPGFAAVTLVLLIALRQFRPGTRVYVSAALSAALIALIAESTQIPGPRDADLGDLIADGIGIFGGLAFGLLFDPRARQSLSPRLRKGLPVFIGSALIATAAPTVMVGWAIFQQERVMPNIVGFEDYWENALLDRAYRDRVQLESSPANWPVSASTIARSTELGRFETLAGIYVYPNWRPYSALYFIAGSGDESSFEVELIIEDTPPTQQGPFNRYYKRFIVGPQAAEYRIDLHDVLKVANGRDFDIERVRKISLRAVNTEAKSSILLDDFRLER